MDKSMCFLTSHASKGGTLDYIFMLRNRLQGDGFKVGVVALFRGDADDISGINVIVDRKTLSPLNYAMAIIKFIQLSLKERPYAIVGVMPLANVLAALTSFITGAKAIATHHSPIDTQGKVTRIADTLFANCGLYSEVICVSKAVAASFSRGYADRFRKKLKTIANAVPMLAPARTAGQVRMSLGISNEQAFVLAVGRLAAQKNPVSAAKAAVIAQNVRLVFAGDGPLRPQIEEFASPKITLLGNVGRQEIADLVHACDVFMQVSIFEGHSLALLEAINARRPLIVSDVPTQVEAVRLPSGKIAALTCGPNEIPAIARAMESAAFDEQVRKDLLQSVNILADSAMTQADMMDAYSAFFGGLFDAANDPVLGGASPEGRLQANSDRL